MRRAAPFALLTLFACGGGPVAQAPSHRGPVRECAYELEEISADPLQVEVSAHCIGRGITGFSAADEATLPFVERVRSSAPVTQRSDGFDFAAAQGDARIRYRVDLERMAKVERRFDRALRVGKSLIAPASTFLLAPEPLAVGVPVSLHVRPLAGEGFASGLLPSAGPAQLDYRLQAHEASVATYGIFGHFQRATVEVDDARIEVVTADAPLDSSRDATQRWVSHAASAVSHFYGAFPAKHALVLLLPQPERGGVVFGTVLPQSAPGVVVLIGQHTTEPELYRDWILVHELFHIGFPSFHDEAKWLDEGSATYFEPIIRARAGDLTELEVWTQFARDMPQGLRAIERDGLEHAADFRGVYWGGAIACLLADVAARKHSHDTTGLDHAFRALFAAGGNATQVWSSGDVRRVVDTALGAPILQGIVDKYAQRGAPVELARLFEQLGVVVSAEGTVSLDDRAELARIRRHIVFGSE